MFLLIIIKSEIKSQSKAYVNKTKDMLFLKQFPTYSGFPDNSRMWTNIGSMQSSGIDLLVSYKDKKGDFSYGADLTFTTVDVEMISLSAEGERLYGSSNRTLTVKGDEPGYFYGYVADGLFQNQTELNSHTDEHGTKLQPYAQVGDVRFKDVNGDGKIDDKDRTKIGSPWADYNIGLNLNFAYKNFDLVANFYSSIGNEIVNQNISDLYNGASLTNKVSGLDQMAWHGEGTSNKMPRLSSVSNRNTNEISDIYMQNADYLRINNLTVGYNFNEILKDFTFISNLKFYVAVNNLYTFTKYDGMDPEVRWSGDNTNTPWASGIDLGLYPQARTVMFGLSADF